MPMLESSDSPMSEAPREPVLRVLAADDELVARKRLAYFFYIHWPGALACEEEEALPCLRPSHAISEHPAHRYLVAGSFEQCLGRGHHLLAIVDHGGHVFDHHHRSVGGNRECWHGQVKLVPPIRPARVVVEI